MPKISLISLHSVQNYGSALQAYASQLYLERLGYEVEAVDFVRQNNLKENVFHTALINSAFWNKNAVTRLVYKILKSGDLNRRYDMFDAFIKENLKMTPHRYVKMEDFDTWPIEADIYCTGSDQTWNTYWNRGFLLPYYLCYAKEGAKKIAYSASFGKTELEEEEKERTKELLSQYDFITVREKTGVEILKDLDIPAEHILDPTLLIRKEEWMEFVKKPDIKGKYMLVYQLSHNSAFDAMAKRLAKEKNLKLIRIGFGKEAYLYGGKVILNPGVLEFLSLIAHADYVITDSFHATSFSVNLNVPLFVWLPKAFTSRVSDFLDLVGMRDRVFDSYEKLTELYENPTDYETVNQRLDAERVRCGEIVERMLAV